MSVSEKDYGDVLLAARIIEIRQEQGLTMEAFAASLGVSQPTQSRVERAKRLPDALYLRALHQRFGVDINVLLVGETSGRKKAAALDAAPNMALGNMTLTQRGSGVQVGQASAPVTVGAPAPRKRRVR